VGGYALAFHGAPRFTGDIDFFIKPEEVNANKLITALDEFGFASIDLSPEDFTTLGNIVQIGVPPVRVDIMTSLTGVSWEQADTGKVQGEYGGVKVYYLGKGEMIVNKQTLGRQKDNADLEALGD